MTSTLWITQNKKKTQRTSGQVDVDQNRTWSSQQTERAEPRTAIRSTGSTSSTNRVTHGLTGEKDACGGEEDAVASWWCEEDEFSFLCLYAGVFGEVRHGKGSEGFERGSRGEEESARGEE